MKDNKIIEEKDRLLLKAEVYILILVIILFVFFIWWVMTLNISELYQTILILGSLIPLFIIGNFCLNIERTAGYYKCKYCNNIYVPVYKNILLAMHIGRIRYMKCPKCNKYSWNKKVISKDN